MKTTLTTSALFLLFTAGWVACKRDDGVAVPASVSCPASAPLVYRHGSSELALPDAITPNGDGKNDVFKPVFKNMDTTGYRLTISSGGDAILFTTTDINAGWAPVRLYPSRTSVAVTYEVGIRYKTADGTIVDTCNKVMLLGLDTTQSCIHTANVGYHFGDQLNPANPAAGFAVPTSENVCP